MTKRHYLAGRLFIACFTLLISSISTLYSSNASAITLNQQVIQWMQQSYGNDAVNRLQHWAQLINDNQTQPELFKLRLVSDFFGNIPFKSDQEVWGIENYWATPLEFMGKNAGDCEDFAIAKFITLRFMGVSEQKLRLVYVVSDQLAQAHMVLAYYETPGAEPLILDNLTDKIVSASDRPDLKPVYMFTSKAVWVTNTNGVHQQIGQHGSQIAAWKDLIARMRAEGLTEGPFNHDN